MWDIYHVLLKEDSYEDCSSLLISQKFGRAAEMLSSLC